MVAYSFGYLLHAIIRCVSFLVLKGTASIRLTSQWYVIIMYRFPLQERMGKRPVSSLYNLLIGLTWRKSSFDCKWGIGSSVALGCGGLGLVDFATRCFWTRCTILVASEDG